MNKNKRKGASQKKHRTALAESVPVEGWFFHWQSYVVGSSDKPATLRFLLLVFTVICQVITIVITWPVWQSRIGSQLPIHLPLFEVEQFSFGYMVLGSLLFCLVKPKSGSVIHFGLLIFATIWDQFRLQPQFFTMALLLIACAFPNCKTWIRIILASIWFWTGLHKFLSPEWWGPHALFHAHLLGLEPKDYASILALIICLSEMIIGLLALLLPKIAAPLVMLLHLGIFLFLSPMFSDWNQSVWAWNLAMALVGSWICWTDTEKFGFHLNQQQDWSKVAATVVLFTYPALYYLGVIEMRFAHLLYNGNFPRAVISRAKSSDGLEVASTLGVPFPGSVRLYKQYFLLTSHPGDKLAISDPRWCCEDAYYRIDPSNRLQEITLAELLIPKSAQETVVGLVLDDPIVKFHLIQHGLVTVDQNYGELNILYSLKFVDNTVITDAVLAEIDSFVCLGKIELEGSQITDQTVNKFVGMKYLNHLNLSNTKITDLSLKNLNQNPLLHSLYLDGTNISNDGLKHLGELQLLEVLSLAETKVGSDTSKIIAQTHHLRVLNLRNTNYNDNDLKLLQDVPNLRQLDLRETQTSREYVKLWNESHPLVTIKR